MSLPKPSSLSGSPSKSSLRATQKSSSPSQPRALLPSPHFDEQSLPHHFSPHSSQALEASLEESEHHQQSPSPFQPFFTLIEDANTSETHHPTVHYIFSDDDTDIVTEAALRAHEADSSSTSSTDLPDTTTTTQKTKEHYLILDLQPITTTNKSYTIKASNSLTSSFQLLDTTITPAPSFDAAPAATGTDNENLMLKIRGTAGMFAHPKQKQPESLEEMVERFEKRMKELKEVVEAAERGSGGDGGGGKEEEEVDVEE